MNPATRESKTSEITISSRGVTAEAAALPLEADDEEGEEEVEAEPRDEDVRLRRHFLAQLGRVRRLAVERDALTRALAHRRRGRPRLAQGRARLEARLLAALCGLGLSRRQTEQVASGLYATLERAAAVRTRPQAVQPRPRRFPAELLRLTH